MKTLPLLVEEDLHHPSLSINLNKISFCASQAFQINSLNNNFNLKKANFYQLYQKLLFLRKSRRNACPAHRPISIVMMFFIRRESGAELNCKILIFLQEITSETSSYVAVVFKETICVK